MVLGSIVCFCIWHLTGAGVETAMTIHEFSASTRTAFGIVFRSIIVLTHVS